MLNKDKRSLIFCLTLGDGCIHYTSARNKAGKPVSGAITIDHGITQADYQTWKAKLLTEVFGRTVRMRTGHKGQSVQVSISAKRMRSWRKFVYLNGHKSIPRLLRFIRHPGLALSVWLMDDGYVEPSLDSKYPDKCYGAILRLFTCDQTPEEQNEIINWFQVNFEVTPKVAFQKKGNKKYPFLKFNTPDSQKIWKLIRDHVLQFQSMRHKFRYIEQRFQYVSTTASTR